MYVISVTGSSVVEVAVTQLKACTFPWVGELTPNGFSGCRVPALLSKFFYHIS